METSTPACPPSIQDGWREWPSNEFFINALQAYRHLLLPDDPSNREDDWQIQARRALLQEYGLLNRETTADSDRMAVQNAWERAIKKVAVTNDNNDNVGDADETKSPTDLIEFFRDGGKSNDRQLEWAIMDCAPGCQFQLHAHPNLELVYCLKGELHEVRLIQEENVALARDFETTGEQTKNQNPQVIGPSLLGCSRPWRFGTLSQGQWLVNRVGSIHKSFTAAKGDGCILLALWGGSHANIPHEPSVVVEAVETMDRRLDCSCRGGEWIAETFLPDSEKSTN
jgi:hypothetical protein